MKVYIKGMGAISPQQSWGDHPLIAQPLGYTDNKLTAIEPDYSLYIDAKQIRRMSRIIKMGIASASMAMKEAGVTMPDAIITGTGYGCLDDTGFFLSKMVNNKEEALNPTPFIQSTHNTIGSQIALTLQCQAYNQTYTHGPFSFENALLDAMLQLSETKEKKLLVGGIDEITPISHQVLSRFGIFRKQVKNSLTLFTDTEPGTLNGEGSSFFVLSGITEGTDISSIESVITFYKPEADELYAGIKDFMTRKSLQPTDIDLILSGESGDGKTSALINKTIINLFPSCSTGVFKHLTGEYPVASAFACWLGAMILKEQRIPEIIHARGKSKTIKNILIFNQYFGTHYTLILLRAC